MLFSRWLWPKKVVSLGIEEGKIVKGGVNVKPTSKRPKPPKGQGSKDAHINVVMSAPIRKISIDFDFKFKNTGL